MHPFFDGLRPTIHVSHRGGAGLAPENTIEACRLALERYATQMLELDLQITRDGVLVVAHDETVERCTDGTGRIENMTLLEVQALDAGCRFTLHGESPWRGKGVRIPTLSDVLRCFPELRLNLELKVDRPGIEDVLAETLRRERAVGRVCCGSEHDALAARIAEVLPEACHFYPPTAASQFILAVRSGQTPPRDERWHVLDIPLHYGEMRLVDAVLVDAARQTERWINVWTIDDPEEMRALVADGVGGIMTDRPDLLAQVLADMLRQD